MIQVNVAGILPLTVFCGSYRLAEQKMIYHSQHVFYNLFFFFLRWKNWQSTWTQMIWEESILRTSVMEFLPSKVCACFIKITYFSATNVSVVAGNVMIKDKTFAGKQQCAFLVDTGINSYNSQQSFLAFIFMSLTN